MPNRDIWNVLLIVLAVIGATAIIAFSGMGLMHGMMMGMTNCYGGMAAAGWSVLLITVIVAVVALQLRCSPQL